MNEESVICSDSDGASIDTICWIEAGAKTRGLEYCALDGYDNEIISSSDKLRK